MVEGVVGGDARRNSSRDLATSTYVFIPSNIFGGMLWNKRVANPITFDRCCDERGLEISLINRTRRVGASMKTRIKSREGDEEDGRSEEERRDLVSLFLLSSSERTMPRRTKQSGTLAFLTVYC